MTRAQSILERESPRFIQSNRDYASAGKLTAPQPRAERTADRLQSITQKQAALTAATKIQFKIEKLKMQRAKMMQDYSKRVAALNKKLARMEQERDAKAPLDSPWKRAQSHLRQAGAMAPMPAAPHPGQQMTLGI